MPDKKFWDERYITGDIGWDLKSISTPLKEYIDTLKDKDLKILIPGAGNSYEAEYLWKKGFKNVFVADISPIPLKNLQARVSEFPSSQLLNEDFFVINGKFDLILEQTFFCAIDPALRPKYAHKMFELLKPGGILAGVLFDDLLNKDKPPFGGSKDEYISYFRPIFNILKFEKCYNSIPPRSGRELFIRLQKQADLKEASAK